MLNRTSWTFAVTWMAILISPAIVRAQALADRLPPDTTLYIGWSGTDANVPGFKGSNFETVLNSSNMRALVDDFLPRALDRVAKEDKDAAQAVQILKTVVGPIARHPFAIGFVGIEINPQAGPRPKLVIVSQAGNESAALKAQIDDLLKAAGPAPFPVNLIETGDALALVVGYDKPEAAIPAAGGDSLATNADFMKTLAQVGKNGAFTEYVDVDKTVALVDTVIGLAAPDMKANWEKGRDAAGLKGVHRAILTAGFDGRNWSTQAFVDAPAPRTGIIASFIESAPLSKNIYDAIPASASKAGAGKFNINGFVEMLRTVAGMIDPNADAQFDQGLQQVNQMLGFDLRKDLLASLGDEWAFYTDPAVAGDGLVSTTIVNHLADPAKAEANITKLEDFAVRMIDEQLKKEKDAPQITIHRVNWGGITIHYVGMPLIEPAWAFRNGNLYFAFYPETVVAAARRAPGDKSITTNPGFATLMRQLGDHPASSFQYTDLPRLVPESYSSWLVISHLSGFGDLFGVPAPVQIIPPLAYLRPLLSASGGVTWTDDAGMHFHHLSPFPGADILGTDPTSMSAAQMPLMISILLPALNKTRAEALKAKSASNLKNIAVGAITYSNTHNGKFPKDMGELLEATGMPVEVFIDPRTNTSSPGHLEVEQAKAWVNEHSDYVWNGAGKDSTMGADDALAWEDPAKVTQGVNILFGDYHVAYYPMAEALQIIEKAKKPKPGL